MFHARNERKNIRGRAQMKTIPSGNMLPISFLYHLLQKSQHHLRKYYGRCPAEAPHTF